MRLRHVPRETSRLIRRALGFKRKPPEEMAPIMERLRPGDTFVDIGAHEGLFSAEAARRVGASGRVLAVEANPALLQRLRQTVAGMENVRIAATAAGEAAGTATLHLFRQDTRSSLLKDSRASAYTLDARNRAGAVTVPVAPLLDILLEHGIVRIDALKIDVEGYEDRVLLPFFRAAPQELWPSWVMIERSHNVWAHDCIEFMQCQLGYGEAWSGRGDTLLAKPVAAPPHP